MSFLTSLVSCDRSIQEHSSDRMGECPVILQKPIIGVETSLRHGGCLLIPVGPSLPSSNQLLAVVTTSDYRRNTYELF